VCGTGHELGGLNQSLYKEGYDIHSIDSDPLLQRSSESIVHPWNRSCTDYAPAAGSPAYEKLGFRAIDAERIGLLPSYGWDVGEIMRVDAMRGRKVQAERYTRMRGLWRTGSSWISGAEGGCPTCHYPFSSDAWARYDHVHTDCGAGCVVQLRFKSALRPDPFSPPNGTGRVISLSVGKPTAGAVIAKTPAPVHSAGWTVLNITTTSSFLGALQGETIFLQLDGECFVDWFRFIPSATTVLKVDDDEAAGKNFTPLVKFDVLAYPWFSKLPFLPLPYTGGTPKSLGKTWAFGVSCCNSTAGFFSEEKIKAASKHYAPFLTDKLECSGCTSGPQNMRVENISSCIGEWCAPPLPAPASTAALSGWRCLAAC
jgi:hypothetical protein